MNSRSVVNSELVHDLEHQLHGLQVAERLLWCNPVMGKRYRRCNVAKLLVSVVVDICWDAIPTSPSMTSETPGSGTVGMATQSITP